MVHGGADRAVKEQCEADVLFCVLIRLKALMQGFLLCYERNFCPQCNYTVVPVQQFLKNETMHHMDSREK